LASLHIFFGFLNIKIEILNSDALSTLFTKFIERNSILQIKIKVKVDFESLNNILRNYYKKFFVKEYSIRFKMSFVLIKKLF